MKQQVEAVIFALQGSSQVHAPLRGVLQESSDLKEKQVKNVARSNCAKQQVALIPFLRHNSFSVFFGTEGMDFLCMISSNYFSCHKGGEPTN